ncbi:MAG TPA: hypothetical protein VMR62_00705 [Bryobacteraceae bacterium]|nr:hypothetical protein [Bryobacteraceae bacterium]
MEKSDQSSFLKNLALAFGDGLLFGVAMRLAQGPPKIREEGMTDLGPLAERLRIMEDHTQTIDRNGLTKLGEGLDGRVLEKVIVALEARLTEHVGVVERRLAEIDAQVALDLKAVDGHTAAQTNAFEKALQQIDAQVRDYLAAAQHSTADQIAEVDHKLNALQEALPAKFREIVEAVRQSMEARVALELTEVENRVSARGIAPEHMQEIRSNLRAELDAQIDALSGRLDAEMRGLVERQQSQTAPLEQALHQLETKLTTLREELPPKIRQIVEAVEASMDARISAGDQQATSRITGLEQALAELRAELPSAGGLQQAIDESLRSHAEQVGALDQKLTVLQAELPPKIKAIVDAVRESLDARMAVELETIEERHNAQIQRTEAQFSEAQRQFREQMAAASKAPELAEGLAQLRADLGAMDARFGAALEQHAAQATAGMAGELEALRAQHSAQIEQLEARWQAAHAREDVPAQVESAVAGLRQSLEVKLAAQIHELEARTADRSPDLDRALQYASLLESRVLALEQKLQRNADETVERAVERVWQAIERRLQERQAKAPQETVTGLRKISTSAEQNVLDLIAGIGQLFEKPGPRDLPPAPTGPDEPEPPTASAGEAQRTAPAEPPAAAESARAAAADQLIPSMAAPDEMPPVILFRPKDTGRKWRIPFVSSFLLLTAAIVWLHFT